MTGPVLEDLSRAYDKFWNAELAYPGGLMSDKATAADLVALREDLKAELAGKRDKLASYPMEPKEWRQELLQLSESLVPGEAHFIQDEPVLLGEEEYRLTDMLRYIAGPANDELTAVSPYLIPVGDMLERMEESSSQGVRVTVLTASMASNNHTPAHSHYKKYRRRILGTGAELFEFKDQPSAAVRAISDVPPVKAKFISLHVKAIVADRARCFIGSLNLDPRAIDLKHRERPLHRIAGPLRGTRRFLRRPDAARERLERHHEGGLHPLVEVGFGDHRLPAGAELLPARLRFLLPPDPHREPIVVFCI